MKTVYFAAILATFALSACSNDKDDSSPSSSSIGSSSSNLGKSSDSGTGTGGCLIKVGSVDFECIEEDNGYGTKQTCQSLGGGWVDSCPPGGVKCERENDGIKFVANFYDVEHNPCLSL